jgi:phage gpG-like protein
MTPEEFQNKLLSVIPQLKAYVASEFPRRAAKIGVDHFKENFRKGGFVNGGLKPWAKAKRQKNSDGKGADANYGTLLSARNELFNSIVGRATNGMAIISSDKPYSQIQNDGGTIQHPGGTAYYPKNGKAIFVKNETAARYQSLHLTPLKRTKPHPITIPQRQYIGESKELNDDLRLEVERKLNTLL